MQASEREALALVSGDKRASLAKEELPVAHKLARSWGELIIPRAHPRKLMNPR